MIPIVLQVQPRELRSSILDKPYANSSRIFVSFSANFFAKMGKEVDYLALNYHFVLTFW